MLSMEAKRQKRDKLEAKTPYFEFCFLTTTYSWQGLQRHQEGIMEARILEASRLFCSQSSPLFALIALTGKA